jgi:lauroyl/myristoyl acyltransferase
MLADPRTVNQAREQMEFLLGVARPGSDIEAAAERYVFRMVERSERRWHTALVTHQRVEGIEHLLDRDAKRGVVLSFMHHGEYSGAMSSIGRLGPHVHAVVDAASLRPDAPEFLKQHLRVGGLVASLVSTDEGSKGFAARLETGQILAIATDVRGSSDVLVGGCAALPARRGSLPRRTVRLSS